MISDTQYIFSTIHAWYIDLTVIFYISKRNDISDMFVTVVAMWPNNEIICDSGAVMIDVIPQEVRSHW